MRILITGGCGYIGGRAALHLSQAGHDVALGTRRESKPPEGLLGFKMVRTEWEDGSLLEQACAGFEVVIHAAGMNAQECAADPVAALAFNGLATSRILAAASKVDVKRFVHLSTAHVYASPLKGTIAEIDCTLNRHPYASSHLAGENAVLWAQQRGQIEGVVMRLSNAFGAPVQKDVDCWTLLVNDLCRQAVIKRTLTLRSTGLQRRDFVTLHDVTRAVAHLVALSKEQIGSGIFNVGGAWAPRVLDIAEMIQARCQSVLGYSPVMVRPELTNEEATPALTFEVAKLHASGFRLTGEVKAEIDATLLFCRDNFGFVA